MVPFITCRNEWITVSNLHWNLVPTKKFRFTYLQRMEGKHVNGQWNHNPHSSFGKITVAFYQSYFNDISKQLIFIDGYSPSITILSEKFLGNNSEVIYFEFWPRFLTILWIQGTDALGGRSCTMKMSAVINEQTVSWTMAFISYASLIIFTRIFTRVWSKFSQINFRKA